MNKTLEGMARAAYRAQYGAEFDSLRDGVREQFMKAALLWLASNVSDEMVHHLIGELFKHRPPAFNLPPAFKFEYTVEQTRTAISAALRAAAGSAPTQPEVK